MSLRRRRARALQVLLLLLAFAAIGRPGDARASGGTVNGIPSSSWQTNDTVFALAYANGAVYVGGNFTSVRPPGAPVGTGEVARNHLAAFDANTGGLLPFDPDVDAPVMALVASPDGSKVYAGGDFLNAGGVAVQRLAAFDTATGAPDADWRPAADGGVRALDVYGDTVYVGGKFASLNTRPRARLAAVDAATGALRSWLPKAERTVYAISAAKDGSKIFVGGSFMNLNGQPQHAIAAVDPTSGALLPFPAASAIPPFTTSCESIVKDLTTDDTSVYVAAEGGGSGCFDGTFAAWVADGTLKWRNGCLGATQSVEVIGSYVYKGSHAHDCSSVIGGFPELLGGHYRLLAENLDDGLLGPWYPAASGETLGPRVFATDGEDLFVGGDFHTINTLPQQGFARFEGGPDLTPPFRPPTPRVASVKPGTVKVNVPLTWDRDDDDLIYALRRDGDPTPIKTWSVPSKAWAIPTIVDEDEGLAPGSTHTYRVQVSDGTYTVKSLTSAPVTVASTAAPYRGQVLADFPWLYWRLGESSGSTAADASGNGRTGIYRTGTTKGQPGAIVGDSDTAVAFDGSSGLVTAAASVKNPQRFSVEAWFKTTTTRGGKLIGFGNSQTGTSSKYDRHVYMTDSGRLVFGVYVSQFTTAHIETITTASAYNDGGWHQVVATLGPSGTALYVDGELAGTNPATTAQSYAGYWRVGGDNLSNWPSRPTSSFFRGGLDEFAVYDYALTAPQVADRYAARG